jgi:tripartite-type tricarboxylate transporter receptor subunit TctC
MAGAVAAMAITGIALAFNGPAVAAAGQFENGVLQPLKSGFPTRPITVMVVDEPGSADSVFATQLVEVASEMSPMPINIQHRVDFSNFGTWEALAWVKDQGELGNDGYIVIVYTLQGGIIDLLVIDMKTEVGVDLEDIAPIAATEQQPFMMHQRADAPWGDRLEDLVAYAKENPDTVRHITGGPGGGQDAAMQFWVRQLGIDVKDIVGGGSGERALAVAAGEGDVTVSPVDVLLPHYQAGRIEVLMASGSNPVPAPWEEVPNAAALGIENDPFDQTRVLGVPATVPEANRQWLQTLFTEASKDEDYRAKRQQVPGLIPVMLGPDEVTDLSLSGYNAALPIMREMGVYWGDK